MSTVHESRSVSLSQKDIEVLESVLNERIAYLSQILMTRSRSAYGDHHVTALKNAIDAKSALNLGRSTL
ncbi:hypothetical protein V8G57_13265 [Collimonas sp. H4R21]|jgi:LPS O-antigen subunit length determinant protein (WzzB/FepE family)|uniref:Uncharacterized protein n=1 Tax=Collimonas rhizosphaerae TaxID=3126357 RepID=A0ABU9PWF6_9BURK